MMIMRREASIIDTGSSATISLGCGISARATDTRCNSPPENWLVYLPCTSCIIEPDQTERMGHGLLHVGAIDASHAIGRLMQIGIDRPIAGERLERVLENRLNRSEEFLIANPDTLAGHRGVVNHGTTRTGFDQAEAGSWPGSFSPSRIHRQR